VPECSINQILHTIGKHGTVLERSIMKHGGLMGVYIIPYRKICAHSSHRHPVQISVLAIH
jgi:hypothetical protein